MGLKVVLRVLYLGCHGSRIFGSRMILPHADAVLLFAVFCLTLVTDSYYYYHWYGVKLSKSFIGQTYIWWTATIRLITYGSKSPAEKKWA